MASNETEIEESERTKKIALLPFEYTLNQSFKNQSDEHARWQFPSFLFGNLFRCIGEKYKQDENSSIDSLVYMRLPVWQRSVHWIILSGYAGLYEAVARELRFMIEDITQAIYIDQRLGRTNLGGKVGAVSVLRDVETRFRVISKKINVPDFLKKEMRSLYKALCDYVHPSRELLEMEVRTLRLIHEYVPSEFDRSSKMHIQTCDVLVALVLFCFPKVSECFLKREEALQIQIQYLKEQGFIHTAQICDELSV